MAWVVDTSILIDIAENDPSFGFNSAKLLDLKLRDGLTICPITYIELSPVFHGDHEAEIFFLKSLQIDCEQEWTRLDTIAAHSFWNNYVQSKRSGLIGRRPIADLLIGAFATRFEGLLTRNEGDFRKHFSTLQIVSP